MAPIQYLWLLLLAAHPAVLRATDESTFEKREFRSPGGGQLRYRLYSPTSIAAGKKYPLVIWLHDILGAGGDNRKQISGTNADGWGAWVRPDVQSRYPSFVAAPQCPLGSLWVNAITKRPSAKLLLAPELIEELVRDHPIDPDRIYVAGQSMGGYGVWALLETRPDLFAAGVPVAGGGRTGSVASLVGIPIWAFHGKRDLLVPVRESRAMIKALRDAGGAPRYTEYPKLGHSRKFWNTVFTDPKLPAWLFSQKRPRSSQ